MVSDCRGSSLCSYLLSLSKAAATTTRAAMAGVLKEPLVTGVKVFGPVIFFTGVGITLGFASNWIADRVVHKARWLGPSIGGGVGLAAGVAVSYLMAKGTG